MTLETATMAGGCYWCLEAYFQRVKGVEKVVSGYSGGTVPNPSADRVYQGDTGHAEVVQITYDANVLSYEEILQIFYVMHDPTTLNRQSNDVGDLYRSVIFYHDDTQKDIAERLTTDFATPLYDDPIVTSIEPLVAFYQADEYMQDYYNRNPNAGYCLVVIDPKIQKLRQKFAEKLK